ncbi:MAG: acylphosphatase [Ardenticatenaceae bacterium]|nr:acylphosphatase [Anaerolineales bacterium]MCB8921975.1 acylphosphatase [Ardenticatenaceae bacterium]MCB8989551.1 acylphosphatase [Ardenticatenaceae bacterium]MCB9003094.1 acylphosphatase [Ardenticatenaceae bacterium]
MKRLEATVYGRVQGVSFRYYTQREAGRLNLVGWVANQADGAVRVVAEGPEDVLQEFETYLHRGSPAAHVSRVESRWFAPSGEFYRFEVRWL